MTQLTEVTIKLKLVILSCELLIAVFVEKHCIFTKILLFSILFQSIDWDSIKWDELSPEQKWKLEHMRLHEKHRGHEKMHTEMILILFATLVISQVALVKWREIYPGSYHVSL